MSNPDGSDPVYPASRVARSRQSARAAYDRLSGWYDWLAGSEEAFNRRALEMLDPRKGERALEIGFGTGHSLEALSMRGCQVAGVDLSLGMARRARERLGKKDLLPNTLLSLGDGARLPSPAGCFDIAFAAFTLELFDTPEIPVVLREIWRVLHPGGRLGVVALSLPERPSFMVRLYEWFHQVMPAYVDCRPIPATQYIQQSGFLLRQVECKNMWGLPVAMVIGDKPSIASL